MHHKNPFIAAKARTEVLERSVPDANAVLASETSVAVIARKPMTEEEWQAQHGADMGAAAGAATRPN
jgi:hypothetical protein